MKTKRYVSIFATTVLLISCGLLTGCKDLEDIVPRNYGEWDGNYVYRGNLRSKTTGEDTEALIDAITIEGEEYAVSHTSDFEYRNDKIYLCLDLKNLANEDDYLEDNITSEEQILPITVTEEDSGEKDIASCFVCYSPKEKTIKLLYASAFSSYDIRFMREEEIVLSASGDAIMLDYDGNILDEDASEYVNGYYTYYGENQEYIVTNIDGAYYYRTWQNAEFTKFREGEYDSLSVLYKEGFTGFLIKKWDKHNGYRYGKEKVVCYNLSNGETTVFLDDSEGRCFHLKGDYFTTSVKKEYSYQTSSGIYDETLNVECKLYKVDWNKDGVTFEHIYDFDGALKNKDFTAFYPQDDGNVYFKAAYVKEGGGCRGDGGRANTSYCLNEETGRLVVKKFSVPTSSDSSATSREYVCGVYVYSIKSETYGGLMSTQKAIKLLRLDTRTGKEETMQCWAGLEEMAQIEGTVTEDGELLTFRYSTLMWMQDEGFYAYQPLDKIMVLAY